MRSLKVSEVENSDLKNLLENIDNRLLLIALENFSLTLKRYGYDVPVYSRDSLAKLAEVSPEKKAQIRTFFDNWRSWIEPEAGEGDILEVNLAKEKMFLKRALDYHGLWLHEDFWNTLAEGQVIEFYGTDGVQLYRNINFFDFCSYSLLDISVFEWFRLWQRPTQIQEEMNKDAARVFTAATPVMKYRVPRHVLREIKFVDKAETPPTLACLVQFKYAGSLFRGVNPRPAGAIATSEAEVIAIGEEAQHIHFV